MWVILHWYFIYICQPDPTFHTITGVILILNDKVNLGEKIEKIPSAIGMLLMYIGFYCRGHILDYGFLPWWVLTVIGIREREPAILLGGIVLGIYLMHLNWMQIGGHVSMNIGRLIRTKQINYRMHGIVHMVLGLTLPFIFKCEMTPENLYVVFLATASSIILVKGGDKMDWFSLIIIFITPTALPLAFLHAICVNWYECYRNNQFKMVKGSYYWFIPFFLILYPSYIQLQTMLGISASKIV